MKIAIIDAQGAGIGKTVIKKLIKEISDPLYITALGTNEVSTSNMIKAGAHRGFSGEAAICNFLKNEIIDCLIGPIGIISSGGIKGEITSLISKAVFEKDCTKYIIPLKFHGIYIPGTRELSIKEIIDEIITDIKNYKKK